MVWAGGLVGFSGGFVGSFCCCGVFFWEGGFCMLVALVVVVVFYLYSSLYGVCTKPECRQSPRRYS